MGLTESFVSAVSDGSLLVAVPVAATAGLVSFLSLCVLPLVPGYLSFVTGLSGQELGNPRRTAAPERALATAARPGDAWSPPTGSEAVRDRTEGSAPTRVRRGRVLLGSVLFVLGFSAVFVTSGAVRRARLAARRAPGRRPGARRRHDRARTGLHGRAARPAARGAERGALLTAAYCLGLGVPFVLSGLMFRRALGAFAVVKRHYGLVMRVGGGLLVLVGLLLVSGVWEDLMVEVRGWVGSFETVL